MIFYGLFRNPKKVYMTESQIAMLSEGVFFTKNQDGANAPIDTWIEPIRHGDMSDSDENNSIADTRVFGTKNNILYGDGTNGKGTLDSNYRAMKALIKLYQEAIEIVRSGKRGVKELTFEPDTNKKSYNTILRKLKDENISDEKLLEDFNERLNVFQKELNMIANKYERTISSNESGRVLPRYDVGLVPGTDVKVIALFKFNDFNFSDAVKNGELRQTTDTDAMLGITLNKRAKNSKLYGNGAATNKKLKTTYDNGTVTPNIASNFSLNGIDTKDLSTSANHFRQQFKSRSAFNDDSTFQADSKESYNSVTQFMDKSILAANYAIKKEGIKIDYILAAPSSSNFNHYYCVNLSRKLGVEYKPDFFARNLVNVHLDDAIYKAGLANNIIEGAKAVIKKAAITEISALLMADVKEFVKANFKYMNNIESMRGSRKMIDSDMVCEVIKHYSYYGLCNMYDELPKTSNLYMYLLNHFMDYVEVKKSSKLDIKYVLEQLLSILRTPRLSESYQELLKKLDVRIKLCSKYLKSEEGWKLSYNKKFKITDIDLKARPYIKNAYVVADSELDAEDNLFERYANANFLLIDEDMNSGGTLKLLIEALKDQVVGHIGREVPNEQHISSDQITCLVNAYTLK